MAKTLKICRVCGKSYEACRTAKVSNAFRWQDVSCSPACGAEYLRRIMISRGELIEEKAEEISEETSVMEPELPTEVHDDLNEDYPE